MKLVLQMLLLSCLACNSPSSPVVEYNLQSANGQVLPATIFDEILTDPNAPPYRFRTIVLQGKLHFENKKYRQEFRLQDIAEGYSDFVWRWVEFGTCTPIIDHWQCESEFIQNYKFTLRKKGDTLQIEQDFKNPALKSLQIFLPAP